MNLDRLDLIAFGQFTNKTLDLSAQPHRFHLIYGANEAGKSTCMRAITSLLFGYARQTSDNYLHANPKLRLGGKFSGLSGQSLEVIRRKTGNPKLLAADGKSAADESALSALLGDIDEDTFHQRFGMSHEKLVAGGEAVLESKGDLGPILFAAGAGISQLKTIQSQLEDDRKKLFADRARSAEISVALKELEEKRKELRKLQTLPAEYKQLCDRLTTAEQRAQSLATETAELARTRQKLDAYLQMLNVVPLWRNANERLAELGTVPTLDEDFAARRREAALAREHLRTSVETSKSEIAELESKLADFSTDDTILNQEGIIVTLFQEIARRHGASSEKANRQTQIAEIHHRLCEGLRDLEIEVGTDVTPEEISQQVERLQLSEATRLRISELASEHKSLRERENAEHQRLQSLQKQLAQIEDELERTPPSGDADVIDSVLSKIGSPDALLSPVEKRQEEYQELELECQRLARELNLDSSDLSAATRIQAPVESDIEFHVQAMNQADQRQNKAADQVEKLRNRQREASRELNRLKLDMDLPTESELSQHRHTRDAVVEKIAKDSNDSTAVRLGVNDLQREITASDQVVDTIRSHHQQVAERAALQTELETLETELAEAEAVLLVANDGVKAAKGEWENLWTRLNLKSASVATTRSWIANHQRFNERHDALIKARTQLQGAEETVRETTTQLASILEMSLAARPVAANAVAGGPPGCNPQDFRDLNLESLYETARHLKNELSESARHVHDLKRQREKLLAETAQAEASYEASVQRRSQWDSEWTKATEKIATNENESPALIHARLKTLDTILDEKRRLNQLETEIQSIEIEHQSFTTRVTQTARLLEFSVSDDADPSDLANTLHRQLQETKTASVQRKSIEDAIASGKEKLADRIDQLGKASTQLKELCSEAGVDDPKELASVEEQSREKLKLIDQRDNAAKQLALVSGGEPLSDFVAAVESQDPLDLEEQLQRLQSKLADAEPERRKTDEEVGALKRELAEIDGGDRAAELNQSIQFLTAKINRQTQEYARLKVASMILQQSIDHYRSENESPVLKIACDAFRDLTCEKYSGLRPEYDDNGNSKLFGVLNTSADDEQLVPVEGMSVGTRDALYMAMRLASLEHQLSRGEGIPVVIDDCLIQLDDGRTAAALKLFSKLSAKTQVILFTHHEHLLDLAHETLAQDECHVHRL